MLRNKLLVAFLIAFALCGIAIAADLPATSNEPVEITADTMTFNTKTNVATADGRVKMIQGAAEITGQHVEYNNLTADGLITGGVTAKRDDATLTCSQVQIVRQDHVIATGNVVAIRQGYRFNSERLEFFVKAERVFAPIASVITTKDGTLHSGQLEYFLKTQTGKANNGVKINSPARQITATAQTATYQGGENATVVLSGNAHAVQNGNTLDGDELKYYMAENSFVADGKTKVVYYPAESKEEVGSKK
ncbi:MAG: LptA/OstA family protein [Bacillota bacterium]